MTADHSPGPDQPRPARRAWTRWALVLFIAALIAGFYLSGLNRELDWSSLRARVDQFRADVQAHLVVAVLVFALLYVAVTALSLPVATGLSLLAGALFGRWLGTVLVSAAATAGATLAFLSTRFLFRDAIERRFGPRLRTIQAGVERDGAYYLLTLRLIPLFPFFLVNLALGLTRMPVRTYIWASWLGMLPATFLFVNAGTALARVDTPGDILSAEVLVSLTLLGLVPLVLRALRRRARPA